MPIRPATPDDAAAIRGLSARLRDQPIPSWRDRAPIVSRLTDGLALYDGDLPEGHIVLVHEGADGRILGYAHAGLDADFFSGEPQGHLYYLATDPAAEGQGIGRGLMDAISDWTREQGCHELQLYVFATNDRGRAVYRRYGFQEDTLKMVKPLAL